MYNRKTTLGRFVASLRFSRTTLQQRQHGLQIKKKLAVKIRGIRDICVGVK